MMDEIIDEFGWEAVKTRMKLRNNKPVGLWAHGDCREKTAFA